MKQQLLKQIKIRLLYHYLTKIKFFALRLYAPKKDTVLNVPIIFIVASGRSGTVFVSKILNTDPSCNVYHEPVPFEDIAHLRALIRPSTINPYINNFRKYDIQYRILKDKCNKYIEVNGYIRLHILALRKIFPNVKIFHLVRDPRNVIRSHMNREVLTIRHPVYRHNMRSPHHIPKEDWREMTRFEKICWLWQYENKIMRNNSDETVHFESLLTDYEYCNQKIFSKLDLNINRRTWEKLVKIQFNPSKSYDFPSFPSWPDDLKRSFNRICGHEMIKLGYDRGL